MNAPGDAFARFRQHTRDYGWLPALNIPFMSLMRRLIGLRLFRVSLNDSDTDDSSIPPVPEGYYSRPLPIEELEPWVGVIEGLDRGWYERAVSERHLCMANFFHDWSATLSLRLTQHR